MSSASSSLFRVFADAICSLRTLMYAFCDLSSVVFRSSRRSSSLSVSGSGPHSSTKSNSSVFGPPSGSVPTAWMWIVAASKGCGRAYLVRRRDSRSADPCVRECEMRGLKLPAVPLKCHASGGHVLRVAPLRRDDRDALMVNSGLTPRRLNARLTGVGAIKKRGVYAIYRLTARLA